MLSKVVLCVCLLVLPCVVWPAPQLDSLPNEYIDGQDAEYMENEKREKEYLEKTKASSPPCNVPTCSHIRCDDAAPPPFCPKKVVICSSGCASVRYCLDPENATYLYQDKFCNTPRRFTPDSFFMPKLADYE